MDHADDVVLNGLADDLTKEVKERVVYVEPEHTAPVFRVHPIGQSVAEGSNVVLECRVDGNPYPEITWLHNGAPITCGHAFSQENEYSRIELMEVLPEDSGSYECFAVNQVGKAQSTAHVHVIRKLQRALPEIP